MTTRSTWVLLSLPLLAFAACAHGPAATRATDPGPVRAAIEATNARFCEALKAGDAAAIAAMFTEDGEVIPPALKAFVVGREALREYYAARVRAARFLEVIVTTRSVEVEGDLAFETGTNRVTSQVGDAPPVTRTGRYVVVWKRGTDGNWRYRLDAIIPDPS